MEKECNCNFCRLSKFNNPTVSYAYYAGYANALEECMQDMKKSGYTYKGIGCDEHHNISYFEVLLAEARTLLCEIIENKQNKIVLLDFEGDEIK